MFVFVVVVVVVFVVADWRCDDCCFLSGLAPLPRLSNWARSSSLVGLGLFLLLGIFALLWYVWESESESEESV